MVARSKLPLALVAGLLVAWAAPAAAQSRKDLNARIAASQDVAWLEKIAGSLSAAAELKPPGGLAGHAKDLRTAAYARLGELATKESLAAVQRIEKQARTVSLTPERVPLTVWTHPCWHFSDDEVKPIVQARSDDGVTYALVSGWLLGDLDVFLVSSKTPEDLASWSRPKMLPYRVYRSILKPALKSKGGDRLVLSFVQQKPGPRSIMDGTFDPGPRAPALGKQRWEFSAADVAKDSDRDGWTDVEEKRLGLDPAKQDTDGDGLADGDDPCPDYAPDKKDAGDEDVEILRKAVFATFGLSGSRGLLLVGAKSRKVQLWGYAGPVLYKPDHITWRKEHQFGAVFVDWSIARKTAAEAVVFIRDWEGPLAASSQEVHLRKTGGKWIVVRRELGPVS